MTTDTAHTEHETSDREPGIRLVVSAGKLTVSKSDRGLFVTLKDARRFRSEIDAAIAEVEPDEGDDPDVAGECESCGVALLFSVPNYQTDEDGVMWHRDDCVEANP